MKNCIATHVSRPRLTAYIFKVRIFNVDSVYSVGLIRRHDLLSLFIPDGVNGAVGVDACKYRAPGGRYTMFL